MDGLDVNSSNNTAAKEIKFLQIDKFLLYIKQETKKKATKKKDIEKDTEKEHIKKVNDKNSVEDANSKPATNHNIKAHIKDKSKLIKKDLKVY